MKNEIFKKATLNFEKIKISKLKQRTILGGLLVQPAHQDVEHSCSCTCIF
ncbi:hypothetical protein [Dokdonia pacifica]|uniref:Uncharacterized protein n=1 Tax=Dokdonia pacifica TaxID=1627892 RepID=A0A239E4W6_9FLAO|nr:hypothetical protein [Dokdonia pacifica]SNS38924.1 hypothetical protein SAMN06265376_11368 [Dokdonia pacifica]